MPSGCKGRMWKGLHMEGWSKWLQLFYSLKFFTAMVADLASGGGCGLAIPGSNVNRPEISLRAFFPSDLQKQTHKKCTLYTLSSRWLCSWKWKLASIYSNKFMWKNLNHETGFREKGATPRPPISLTLIKWMFILDGSECELSKGLWRLQTRTSPFAS